MQLASYKMAHTLPFLRITKHVLLIFLLTIRTDEKLYKGNRLIFIIISIEFMWQLSHIHQFSMKFMNESVKTISHILDLAQGTN